MEQKSTAIIELRAGTGGDEAALFVADVFKMYTNYATSKGWAFKTLESAPTSIGGFKQITFEVSGENAYNLLRYEGGVHRVQRVPKTEKGGRVHTSTITVAVLKKVSEQEFSISPKDLRVEFFKSSGPGGQNVNKRETAVRVIHIPTNTIVESQSERGQQANREYAMSILRSRVSQNLEEQRSASEQEKRKSQVGTGERSEKIRTYNFPQNRLTDHRIKKSWHNLDHIMNGNLDKTLKQVSKGLN